MFFGNASVGRAARWSKIRQGRAEFEDICGGEKPAAAKDWCRTNKSGEEIVYI
jgi:hypothetical protein